MGDDLTRYDHETREMISRSLAATFPSLAVTKERTMNVYCYHCGRLRSCCCRLFEILRRER